MTEFDPVKLEIFKHLFAAVAEEMGAVLRKASYSPNIKERRDFSCAVFDVQTDMVAQAAHIPVHLGAMPLSVQAAVSKFGTLSPGDTIILNDPFHGGTHLPDITLVTPVYSPDEFTANHSQVNKGRLMGFVASRAHHADIGGMSAGSMPVSNEIFQEGLVIPPIKLVEEGQVNQALMDVLLANVRTPRERLGDLHAQLAANQRGKERLQALAARYGWEELSYYMQGLLEYTERMTRSLLKNLQDGVYTFTDYMDNDGISDDPVPICVTVEIDGDTAVVDFSGSAPQQKGSINAVEAITRSAVYYVFRCLLGLDVPNNSGCMAPVKVIAPPGSVVNALPPAAVAAGNVETSQRIVDVLLGALSKIEMGGGDLDIPAASQGTMNNLTIGGYDVGRSQAFAYYETIAGGMGARPYSDGPSAVHSHMTNTLNTPVEALEYAYPLRVLRYEIRTGSGGEGKFKGGDGIRRDVQSLVDGQATILSERRILAPYGLNGGSPGQKGENRLIRNTKVTPLPGKGTIQVRAGDVISILTPGGGGYGRVED